MFPARALILTAVAVTSFIWASGGGDEPGFGPAVSAAAAPPKDQVLEALEQLRVEPERPRGYSRDLFPHWSTHTDGCSTREKVLIAESSVEARVSPRYCTVRSGRWFSAYDRRVITDPKQIQIDHVVALKEAWDSGAWSWDQARREAFANDLTHPESLRAVSSVSNQQKSDKDPAKWLPHKSFRCAYVREWVVVKLAWDLSVDRAEKAALSRVITACAR